MKRDMTKRVSRVIVRGEISNHSHIVTGECEITEENGDVIIKAGKNCAVKHLIESVFVETGVEQWTTEHADIQLAEGESYKYVQQKEYNPYLKAFRSVLD
jgi:hypothetical protein